MISLYRGAMVLQTGILSIFLLAAEMFSATPVTVGFMGLQVGRQAPNRRSPDFNGLTVRLTDSRSRARASPSFLVLLSSFLIFDDVRSYPLYYHGASSTFFADIVL